MLASRAPLVHDITRCAQLLAILEPSARVRAAQGAFARLHEIWKEVSPVKMHFGSFGAAFLEVSSALNLGTIKNFGYQSELRELQKIYKNCPDSVAMAVCLVLSLRSIDDSELNSVEAAIAPLIKFKPHSYAKKMLRKLNGISLSFGMKIIVVTIAIYLSFRFGRWWESVGVLGKLKMFFSRNKNKPKKT